MNSKQAESDNVGAELFELVERDQGYAFVSDAISGLPPERVFDIARGALKYTEASAKKLRRFLKKYGEKPELCSRCGFVTWHRPNCERCAQLAKRPE